MDTGPLKPGQSFGRRYHIKRMLGLGGMGAVYQAWDTELGVDVAIKLIRSEIIASSTAAAEWQRRFKRELLLARLVSHRNVVRIHDLGEIDGIKYITMSYVDGTDLASLLQREAPLPVPRALRIARGICDGLIAAHAAGVVHRDLKPANVMVGPGDEALITDFGIARLSADRAADLAGVEGDVSLPLAPMLDARYAGLTRQGSMVGTVEYMPPEQARGETVDQRADVYALGLILYDMLAGGARLASAPTPLAELEERGTRPPPSLRVKPFGIPAPLDALVARCVQPEPYQRFQSSAALGHSLAALDDSGNLLPVRRTVGLPRVLAVAALASAVVGAAWWYFRPEPPPAQHDPVSVVIADFSNSTGDFGFDRTLEPVVKLSLETATFVTAFARSDIRRGLGVQPPEPFDAKAATELAIKQGLGAVLVGSIERDGAGFRVQLVATQPITGTVITEVDATAAHRDAVLAATVELADEVREALGDDPSDAQQRFAMDTLTATSIDVVRDYAIAMDSLAGGRVEAALVSFGRAVARDPSFGLAHAGLAIASANLGRQQDAERHATEAIRHVDRMTERERFRTRGLYYYVTSDYASCVKEYSALVERFTADTAARNNLALCLTRLRDMNGALEQMRAAVAILPNRALYRVNLALYAAYAGDFAGAETEALKAKEMSPFGFVPLGFARLGLARLADARATLREFATVNSLGASHAASGLGDIAAYEGRFGDAVDILERGAAVDLEAKEADRAAAKYAAIAHAELWRGNRGAAVAAAHRALEQSTTAKIRFLAARVFAQAGEGAQARKLAEGLGAELQAEPRAYAKIVDGELALVASDPRAAIKVLEEANALLDTWIGRFTLGRAYLDAKAFAQADSEFDRCTTRRGEALALFLDEEPTFAHYPAVEYFRGRVREGLGSTGYADSYRRYLDIRGAAGEDPLLPEIRRRIVAAAPSR
jgi:tetratricopeptide (TPR) repeat protein